MEIYLIRHGQSEANLSKTVQGTMDSPLTDLGRSQASQLAEYLPGDFDHYYSSPLSRALDTCLIAMDLSPEDPNLTIYEELQEIHFGELQGTPYDGVPYPRDKVKSHLNFTLDMLKGAHGAERLEDFLERTNTVFDRIKKQMRENNWKKVAVFTHGGVLRGILQFHLKLTSGRFYNTEIAVLSKINGEWSLERLRKHIEV